MLQRPSRNPSIPWRRGLPTTAGTRLRETHEAEQDSTAVGKLAEAGMILLGKTNTVQFAYGGGLTAAHSPSPTMDNPVLSTMRWIGLLVGTRRNRTSTC